MGSQIPINHQEQNHIYSNIQNNTLKTNDRQSMQYSTIDHNYSNKINQQPFNIFTKIIILIIITIIIILFTQIINYSTQQPNHNFYTEHTTHILTYPYPALGVPQVGKQFNNTIVKYGLDYYQFQKQYNDLLLKPYNDTDCQYARYGYQGQGGYVICKNFLKKSQAMISVGIHGTDKLGCDISKQFNIPNYQYDCSDKRIPQCDNNLNKFYFTCIGDRTQIANGIQFQSLKNMIDLHNLTNKHVTIKIDVQGAEWPGLRSFPIQYLDYVDQFIFQFHLYDRSIGYKPVWGNIQTIKSLSQKFISVNMHMTNFACQDKSEIDKKNRYFPSFAIEMTFINKKLITIKNNTRSYKLHPLNHPNSNQLPDCQMQD